MPLKTICFNGFVVVRLRQVMVTNVTSLLKTVKAVEDEATRGTRALEATIECIKQELAVRGEHVLRNKKHTLLSKFKYISQVYFM